MTCAMNGGGNAADDLSSLTTSERARTYSTSHTKFIVTGVLLLFLSGCKFAGTLAKESLVAASSRNGWDTFSFRGQLPAEFGIDVYAIYAPNDPNNTKCQTHSYTQEATLTRSHSEHYLATIKDQPQNFEFSIPLTHHKGLCAMKVARLALEINARYGTQKWQQTYGRGSFAFKESTDQAKTPLASPNVFTATSQCTFLFQQSKLWNGIDKRLICTAPESNIISGELKNKAVHLIIESNPEEEPANEDTWIKFPNGWKPCAHKGNWRWCRDPIEFQTFLMNGQTCTIYPSCTEQEQ